LIRQYSIFILLLILATFLSALDYPPSGADLSNLRCSGGIVSTNDLSRVILQKCGEPMLRESKIADQPYEIWLYRFGQSKYIYYFGFFNDRLQRIYQVNCMQGDPNCE
jgi:hypothetical protein